MRTLGRIRNVGIYLAFSMATSAIGFAAVIVLTRLLPPNQYGAIAVFFSVLFFVAPLLSLSADGLIGVNKATLTPERYLAFQQTYISIAYACFAVVQPLFVIGWCIGAYGDFLFAAAPLLGLVRFLAGMAATEYVADQRPFAFGTMAVLTSLFSLLLTVALVEWFGAWAGFRIFALFAADLLMLGVRYHGRLRILLPRRWKREFALQIVRFGIPSLAAVAGGWALNESDKVIVARLAGMDAAGLYAAAAALATIMLTFNQSLTNALYPEMFRKLESHTGGLLRIVTSYTVSFVGLASAFSLAVIAGYLLVADLLLPARYLGGRDVFIALVLSGIAVSLYRPFGLLADYFRLARIRAAAILCGGVVTVAVSVIGIGHGSLLWAPAGIAAGYGFAAFLLAGGVAWVARQR